MWDSELNVPHIFIFTTYPHSRLYLQLAATLRWFTAGGAIRITHYDVIDDVVTWKLQQVDKNGDHLTP